MSSSSDSLHNFTASHFSDSAMGASGLVNRNNLTGNISNTSVAYH